MAPVDIFTLIHKYATENNHRQIDRYTQCMEFQGMSMCFIVDLVKQ